MYALINFLLYSNIFIACCAVAMTAQTLWALQIPLKTSPPLVGLVFFSTLVIYAIHRLVSLNKIDKKIRGSRFDVTQQYKSHIQLYALLSVVGGSYCFFLLNRATQVALVLPAILSLGYVIPFLGNRKLRLRDINFLKIFLIAIVWAYVTVLLPILEFGVEWNEQVIGLLAERLLFIFVITLPFDIRDWEIDKHNEVKTIPALIGVAATIRLAIALLVVWLLICWWVYPMAMAVGITLTAVFTAYLLWMTPKQQHDYFFTALVDGTMIIQATLVILTDYLLK